MDEQTFREVITQYHVEQGTNTRPSPETSGSSEVKELSLALRLLTEVRWMHW